MQGTVMAFSRELMAGYIRGEDGEEYLFSDLHWREAFLPQAALRVSFEAVSGIATNVTRN